MEHFSYYNIFETKGIEYLIIITFLILLIPFTIILDRKVRRKAKATFSKGVLSPSNLMIPEGILHAPNHTWVHLAKTGTAMIGLDDLLLKITGDVSIRCLREPGDKISKGEIIGEMLQNDRTLKIFSPLSGRISSVNHEVSAEAGKINEDPYFSGWICKLKPSGWKSETKSYLLAEDSSRWCSRELQRFKDFLALNLPQVSQGMSVPALQDGGELRDGILPELPDELWSRFQKEFMDPVL
jgi:glycine cleavage system H protein